MNDDKKKAAVAGWLFIAGTVCGIMSAILSGSILGSRDYLAQAAAHQTQLTLSALLVLSMGFTLALIPVVLYPVLKKHDEVFALGYVVFRGCLETVTYLVITISFLLLAVLVQGSSAASITDPAALRTIGFILKKAAETGTVATAIVFPLGALMLYTVLFRSKLVPRWLSLWGIIGVLLHLSISGLAVAFTMDKPLPEILTILNLPIAVQEMYMAVYLIAKGFDSSAPLHVADAVPVAVGGRNT